MEFNLSRLQIICSCRSGAQIPSCCAHCSTIIWLIYYSLYGGLEQALKETKQDLEILQSVHNFSSYKKYIEAIEGDQWYQGCPCGEWRTENVVLCEVCECYFHPSCLGQTEKQIETFDKEGKIWHCTVCSGYQHFVCQNSFNWDPKTTPKKKSSKT